MIPKSNLHTHTRFCDGKDSAEEVVLAAIAAGMETVGFSGHSGLPFSTSWTMKQERTREYQKEILRLKAAYRDQIHILLGIEQDYLTGVPDYPYEYVIGSVHCIEVGDEHFMIDESAQVLTNAAKKYYGGDFYKLCRAYYEYMAEVIDRTHGDIVGHFDLVTKFNGDGTLFDENDPRHLRYAIDALDVLLKKDVVFEINTGAISRGYRRIPYPAPHLLRRIAEKGGRVMINSDAHSAENLLCKFDEAIMIARAVGFGSIMEMTANGWRRFNFDRIFAK